jgi:c-di-GMP-binding flagellar brake protein YcgR
MGGAPVPFMERRRFARLSVILPVKYTTAATESGDPYQGQGLTRDISLSGSYFHVDSPGPLQPGRVISLSIDTSLPSLDSRHTSHFQARGEVMRLEPPGSASPFYGVAVNFLEGPFFPPASA